jgi:transcriptional regulator with XRE-family HTH domain
MKIDERALTKAVGNAIAKRRLASNLTQEQVAERLMIGNEAVSRMERGTVMPTVARLMELAEIFKCPAGDLLDEFSNRAEDQEKVMMKLIENLPLKDRLFVVSIVERLSLHLNHE